MAPRTSRAAGQGFSREDSGPCLTRTEKAWRRHVGACPAVHPRPAGWGLCSCDRRDSKAGPVLSRRRGRDRSGWSGRQAGRPLPPARHRLSGLRVIQCHPGGQRAGSTGASLCPLPAGRTSRLRRGLGRRHHRVPRAALAGDGCRPGVAAPSGAHASQTPADRATFPVSPRASWLPATSRHLLKAPGV